MGSFYTKDDFISALREAGICSGDLIMTHVGMSGLRALPKGIKSQEEMSKLCTECLFEVIGDTGTLCVPSFTYSLGAGECYDPDNTPTKNIGEFPEFFRKLPGVKRSNDPFLAICAFGPMADKLLQEHANTSYGYGSFFDTFVQAGGQLVTIGVGIRWATIRYHFTEISNAPFRYIKFFTGERIVKHQREYCEWFYSVAPYAKNVDAMSRKLGFQVEDALNKSTLLKRASLGNGYINCIEGKVYRNYLTSLLTENPWISGNGINSREQIIDQERERTGEESFQITLQDKNLLQIAKVLAPLPRYLISDGYDASIKVLAQNYGFDIHSFYTGTKVRNMVIPERWIIHKAYIENEQGEKILSTEAGNLEVVAYSKSFDNFISKDELLKHLHISESNDAIPLLSHQYTREWGLCCCSDFIAESDKYHVVIDSDFSFDTMKIGDWCIQGESKSEILFVAHLTGAKQFNYGLSGVLAGLELFDSLKDQKLKQTYRLLIVPDSIGLAAWIDKNSKNNIKNIISLDILATPNGKLTVIQSQKECVDFISQYLPKDIEKLGHLDNPFSEERICEIVEIPILRFLVAEKYGDKNWPYKGFHTTKDTIETMSYTQLIDSINVLKHLVEKLEAN